MTQIVQDIFNVYAIGLLVFCVGGTIAAVVGGVIRLAQKWMAV